MPSTTQADQYGGLPEEEQGESKGNQTNERVRSYDDGFPVKTVDPHARKWAKNQLGQKREQARDGHHNKRRRFTGQPPDQGKLHGGAADERYRLPHGNGEEIPLPPILLVLLY